MKASCYCRRYIFLFLYVFISTQVRANNAVVLDEMPWLNGIPDNQLSACVERIARDNNWLTPDKFTEITCHNKGIKSLDGLHSFVNVEKLSFYKNKISTVDLTPYTLLKHVNLARNKIQVLHVSSLKLLEVLYLFNNNIESLSLSHLPVLNILKSNSNNMHTFSYDHVDQLKKIYLFDNQLKDIDIHSLPQLKYMDVRQNPMPDTLYEDMDKKNGITILHDGNADDWS